MKIHTDKLKGSHVYLELLTHDTRKQFESWQRTSGSGNSTKCLLIDETYDKQFDDYFNTAMDPQAMGGQQAFVIRKTAGQRDHWNDPLL